MSATTPDELSYLYTQVQGRLEQIRFGQDLFGFPAGWVPRLSYQYYADLAETQLQSLGTYEKSFWEYFDSWQEMMKTGATLREALVINVYRLKDVQADIDRALSAIKNKEKEITDGDADF